MVRGPHGAFIKHLLHEKREYQWSRSVVHIVHIRDIKWIGQTKDAWQDARKDAKLDLGSQLVSIVGLIYTTWKTG